MYAKSHSKGIRNLAIMICRAINSRTLTKLTNKWCGAYTGEKNPNGYPITKERFLFRLNNSNGNPVIQSCSWLEGRDNKLTICTENVDTWLNAAGSSIKPAREMCMVSCNLCII